MRASSIAWGVAFLVVAGVITGAGLAQEGVGERVGERVQDVGRGLKRGVQDLGAGVRKRFDVVRTDVQRMGTHSRVYSRLHWDRSLHHSNIEVHMLRGGSVLLWGTVPDKKAKDRALEIARHTMGVTSVVDELTPLVSDEAPKDDTPKPTVVESPQ